jgi:hypothetical protein
MGVATDYRGKDSKTNNNGDYDEATSENNVWLLSRLRRWHSCCRDWASCRIPSDWCGEGVAALRAERRVRVVFCPATGAKLQGNFSLVGTRVVKQKR